MKKIISLFMLLCFLGTTIPSILGSDGYEPMADVEISIIPSISNIIMGETINISIYVNPMGNTIDTVAIDLSNFTGSLLNCTNITRGNLFPASIIWMDGVLDNFKLIFEPYLLF